MPKVSVIIASHRQEYIPDLLASLCAAASRYAPSETVVVADYPVESYRGRFPGVTWIFCADTGIPAKRNRGIAAASGGICGFIDDDCLAHEEWLSQAVDYLDTHPEMAGVEGLTGIEESAKKGGAYREFKRLEKPGYRTNNIFYRRKTLCEVQMFDERFSVQREDVDLAYAIIEAGGSVGYSDRIRVTHRFRDTEKWDLLKNCVNRRFDPLLHLKHKKLYRKHIRTPFTPAIAVILLLHLAVMTSWVFWRDGIRVYAVIDLLGIITCTIRRAGLPLSGKPLQWLRELVSFVLSPFVLLGALVHGCMRFRHFLLF